jgi:hypothetical protein
MRQQLGSIKRNKLLEGVIFAEKIILTKITPLPPSCGVNLPQMLFVKEYELLLKLM